MKTKIRTDVLNLSMRDWLKIDQITVDDSYIEVSPEELLKIIEFSGGQFLSAKLNDEEKAFVDAYYDLGRSLDNNKSV